MPNKNFANFLDLVDEDEPQSYNDVIVRIRQNGKKPWR